jgi:dienelactone hydrolase
MSDPSSRDIPRAHRGEAALTAGGSPMPSIFPKIVLTLFLLTTPAGVGETEVTGETDFKSDTAYQTHGVKNLLPVFYDSLAERLDFPFSWSSGKFKEFQAWRETARKKILECLLKPPREIAFDPVIVAERDYGKYKSQKVIFNITADSRILSYLLVPKGKGPFPAVLLLHDHGSRFDIGKEKVIEPWNDRPDRIASAREWVDRSYGGRFIGDELASRGYICFATDALNWSDRGGAGYDGQQALASNLLNLGTSFAGLIAWEDLRAAEFLAALPGVDSSRIAAIGFSMGAFRAWQVAALSDRIAGAIAICWMATHKGLTVPGNNLVRGQSAFTTTHPGLSNYLDYADVASLACPKPMLFYGGNQDRLFPVASVREAYEKMCAVWKSQNAGERLLTKLWNTGHIFNREMQDEAFEWLDTQFQSLKTKLPAEQPVHR